jgi:hypothetical protein
MMGNGEISPPKIINVKKISGKKMLEAIMEAKESEQHLNDMK